MVSSRGNHLQETLVTMCGSIVGGISVDCDSMTGVSLIILMAIVFAIAYVREWIAIKASGWDRLAQRYRARGSFRGKYRACWWAQFVVAGSRLKRVADVGRMSRWPFRLEFPPYWIGAASEGLHLKRNAWNFLHPALLIPWDKIQSANEVTFREMVRNSGPSALVAQPMALHPVIAAAQGLTGPLLELKLSDPNVSLIAQLAVFDEARPFLGAKLRLLNSPGV